MKKIAIVGLGAFGIAIGRRLATFSQGELIGIDINERRRIVWETLTNEASTSSLETVDFSSLEKVFIVVRTEEQVRHLMDQIEEIHQVRGLECKQKIFVVTTVSPQFSQKFGERKSRLPHLVELPLTGGEAGALSGSLIGMEAGGLTEQDKQFLNERLTSFIASFSSFGSPAKAKLLNNAMIAYEVGALRHLIQIAHEQRIDTEVIYQVIANGPAGSYITKAVMHYNQTLLEKDMTLLKSQIGDLPNIRIDDVEEHFLTIRRLLSSKHGEISC